MLLLASLALATCPDFETAAEARTWYVSGEEELDDPRVEGSRHVTATPMATAMAQAR